MHVCVCVSREQEQKVKAHLRQTYNLVKKEQSANIAASKASQHLTLGTSWRIAAVVFVCCASLFSEQAVVTEL